ncbi:MAG: SPOR domain-containing protein, partial [Endozoicomonas sp.]
MDQNHKLAKNIQKKPLISTLVSSKLVLHQPNYSQKINQPVFSEVDDNTRYSNSLLTLSGDQYVLQWMAAKERGQLEALKQRYPVLKNALIAQYKRSGHIWFVLIDGPFKNRADAMAELGTPPRSAMASELYPWARSLASIQRLNPVISDPSYRVANNDYHNPVDALASGSTPLLVTTDQNVPYFNQPYMGPNSYNAKVYPSQRVRVATKRQGYSDRPTTNQQQNNKHHTTLPYGTEFEENTSLINQNDKSIIIYQESPTVSGTYNNTASVYDNNYTEQQFDQNIDYNQQNGGQRPHKHVVPAKSAKPFKTTAPITQRQYSTNVLTANPKSYTIQWMSSSRKASLKRAQLRYGELQNTQIIRYTRKNRQRYLLVSMLFVNRSDAMHALLKPSLARVSTRFSPKIRQVSDVQTLVSNTSQSHHARVGSALEPELYKRQWLGTDDPGDQKYITHRRIEYQQSHTIANNGYGALPATVRAPESNRASVITPHKEQLNALLNTR